MIKCLHNNIHWLFGLYIIFFFSSCTVKHPKYFMVDEVFKLDIGMTKEQVDSIVGITPYNVLSIDSNQTRVYTYVYRTNHIKRIPIIMSRKKGLKTEGLFSDLQITYTPNNIVINIETCTDCGTNYINESKIDINKLIANVTTLLTVTVPTILLFLSTQ